MLQSEENVQQREERRKGEKGERKERRERRERLGQRGKVSFFFSFKLSKCSTSDSKGEEPKETKNK